MNKNGGYRWHVPNIIVISLLVFGCFISTIAFAQISATYTLGQERDEPFLQPPRAYPPDEPVDITWTVDRRRATDIYDRYDLEIINPQGQRVFHEHYDVAVDTPLVDGNATWDPSGYPYGTHEVKLTTVGVNSRSREGIFKEFGVDEVGSLRIIKFEDSNMNKVKDASETGLSDWKFKISREDDPSIYINYSTGSLGEIFIDNLMVGDYIVSELPLSDQPVRGSWNNTTRTEQIASIAEDRISTVYFGNVEYCDLIINKFDDINEDERLDPSIDPRLPGIEFNIQGPGVSFTRTTDSSGRIELNDIPPGNYSIRESTSRRGYEPLPEVPVTLKPGDKLEVNLLNIPIPPPDLVIFKFEDKNRNGVYDRDEESGIQGWTFNIDGPEGRYTRTTDRDGRIELLRTYPGTYTVEESRMPGWTSTTQAETRRKAAKLTLDYGDKEELRFGNTKNRLEVIAFEDRNNNGVQDPGELRLSGWRFDIDGASKFTDEDGVIRYEYTRPGEYVIVGTLINSDLWYNTTPLTQRVTLDDGDKRIEFGYDRYRDLTISKFDDENENKVRDSTEIGLSSWEFYVEGPDGKVATYPTGGDGEVSVKVRSNSAYTVSENTIVGWRNTTPSAQRVTIGPDDNEVELNFGNTRIPLTINIHKFNDLNNDSIQNDDEMDAMPGWNFTITDPEGKAHRVTTNPNGLAVFTSKIAGNYVITEENRTGWISTTPRSIRTRYLLNGEEYGFYFGNTIPVPCSCRYIYDPQEPPWPDGDENVEVIKSINPDTVTFDKFDDDWGTVINYTITILARPKMVPADLVIAADTSTSMSPLLTSLSNSISGFADASRAYPDLRIGLVSWDDNVDEEGTIGLTTDRDALIMASRMLRSGPYETTNYQTGLTGFNGALSKFSESPRDARKLIVFITDASGECKPFTDLSGLDPEDYAINVISVSPVQDNETKCMLENVTMDFNGELIIVDDPAKIEAELLRLSRENLAESQLNNVHLVDSLPGYLYPCDYTVNPPDEVRRSSDGEWETTTLEWDVDTISPNWSTSFEAIFCWRIPADVSQPEDVARVTSEVTYADPKTGDERSVLIPEGGIRIGPTERSTPVEPTENGGIPGFGILVSIAGLAAAAYLFKRD